MSRSTQNVGFTPQKESYLLFSSLQYYAIPLLYLNAFAWIHWFQNPWVPMWILYTLVPLLDELFYQDWRNPNQQESVELGNNFKFKFPLYLSVFADWAYMYWILSYLQTETISLIDFPIVLIMSGNMAASNFNIAHELFHKDDPIDKALGTLTMTRNLYMHFAIEHVFGHHKNVSTPIDPTSGDKNITVYQFIPSAIIGSIKSVWHLEQERIQRINKTKSGLTYQNRLIWMVLAELLFTFHIYYTFGFSGLIYFLIMCIISVSYLETINYIEHYGLRRKEISKDQVFMSLLILHTVGMPHIDLAIICYLSYKGTQIIMKTLISPTKRYALMIKVHACHMGKNQTCNAYISYTVCLLMALFPKLWFEVMNKQLEDWQRTGNGASEINYKKVIGLIRKVALISSATMALSFVV